MGKKLIGYYPWLILDKGEEKVTDCTKCLVMGGRILVPSADAINSEEWVVCRE